MTKVKIKFKTFLLLFFIVAITFKISASPDRVVRITGQVFLDSNTNCIMDIGENGLPGVMVSNGYEIVLTDSQGTFNLTTVLDGNRFIFITRPNGFSTTTCFFYRIGKDYDQDVLLINFGLTPDARSAERNFSFLVTADSQFGNEEQKRLLIEEYREMNELSGEPAFLIVCGDLTGRGTLTQLEMYREVAAQITNMPCYNLFGGHDGKYAKGVRDISNYELKIGPPYYSWDYGNRHFVAFVSELDYLTPTVRARQAAWLERDLALQPKDKEIILACHTFPHKEILDRWSLQYNIRALVHGHRHENAVYTYNDIPFLITGPIRGGDWGTFTRSFRIIRFQEEKLTSELRVTGQNQRLEIVSPALNDTILHGKISLLINAYNTTTWIQKAECELRGPSGIKLPFSLTQSSDWSWQSEWDAKSSPPGRYEISVTVWDNTGASWHRHGKFFLLDQNPPEPRPGTDWPGLLRTIGANRTTPDKVIPPLTLSWIAPVDGDIATSSPVILGNTVYMGVEDEEIGWPKAGVVAIDAGTGERLWKTKTESIKNTVAVADGCIYALSVVGRVYCLDATTGAVLWRQETYESHSIYKVAKSACVVADGRIFAFVELGPLVCFDSDDGRELWRIPLNCGWIRQSAPTINEETVYIAENDRLLAVDIETGRQLWLYSKEIGSAISTPVIADGKVYINANTFHTFRASDGQLLWQASTPTGSKSGAFCPAVKDGFVYGGGATLVAMEAESGKKVWEHIPYLEPSSFARDKRQQLGRLSAPAISGDIIYIGSDSGYLSALEASTGREIWNYFIGVPIKSSPIISGNTVYIGAWDGNLYAFTSTKGGFNNKY